VKEFSKRLGVLNHMFPVITKKRLVLTGAIATVTAVAAGGTALAARSAAAPLTATTQPQQSATSPSPAPGMPTKKDRKGAGAPSLHLGRVTAVSATSITVVDAAGTSTTYTLSPKVKVATFNHKTEAATAIPTGELVVIVTGHQHGAGKGQAVSPSPTPAQPAPATAVAIEDTGFKAA
jgi:hypothetical protein